MISISYQMSSLVSKGSIRSYDSKLLKISSSCLSMQATIHELFVPGRLCILGEHSDWAAEYRNQIINPELNLCKGYAVVCTTNEGIYALCNAMASKILVFRSTDSQGNHKSVEMRLDGEDLMHYAMHDAYFGYIAGTAHTILSKYGDRIAHGLEIDNYRTTLPMGKGLSSSAAVAVLVAQAFDKVYALQLSMMDMMELAYLGEMMTPSRCGRMDQCVAMGANAIGCMEFDVSGCQLIVVPNHASLYFVVADLCADKDTIAILRNLNACFPQPVDDKQQMMFDYVALNVDIVSKTIEAIRQGDIHALAVMINRAQDNFDRYVEPNSPAELAAPRLKYIRGHDLIQQHALASKGVGSQGDGSIQILCTDEDKQRQVLEIVNSLGCNGFLLTIGSNEMSNDSDIADS